MDIPEWAPWAACGVSFVWGLWNYLIARKAVRHLEEAERTIRAERAAWAMQAAPDAEGIAVPEVPPEDRAMAYALLQSRRR